MVICRWGVALGLCVQLLGQAGFRRLLGSVDGRAAFLAGVELLDDRTDIFLAVLEGAVAEATPCRLIQCGLVEACRLPLCIEHIGVLQRLRHVHTSAHCQVDVEDRCAVALSRRLATQT